MKKVILSLLLCFPCLSLAGELTINFEVPPIIYIGSHDYMTLIVKPDGEAKWIGDLPTPIKDNKIDWEQFHKEAPSHALKTKYTKEQYEKILELALVAVSDSNPKKDNVYGEGFTSFCIIFMTNPEVEIRFKSIGGNDFPESVYKLNNYLKSLPSPNNSAQ
jgi:hypothetical protein